MKNALRNINAPKASRFQGFRQNVAVYGLVGGSVMALASTASAADGDYVAAAVTSISAGSDQTKLIFGAMILALVGLTVYGLIKRSL